MLTLSIYNDHLLPHRNILYIKSTILDHMDIEDI